MLRSFLPTPIAVHILGIRLPIWGMINLVAAITFIVLFFKNTPLLRKKQKIELLIHLVFWGLLGFHLYRVLFVTFKYEFLFSLRSGIDSFGVILGFAAMIIYLRLNKIDMAKCLDSLALPIIITGTIARLGCALIADEIGTKSEVIWAIFYNGALRHPIGLYYFLVSSLIVVAMLFLKKMQLKKGNLFLLLIILYSGTRVLLDHFREIPAHIYSGLSIHQLSYGIMFIAAVIIFAVNSRKSY
jgi:prolipoprotein diacylglyceryltransferase